MTMQFASETLSHLTNTVRAASTPFEYGRLDEWRADVLHTSIALLGGEMGHFDVSGLGLENHSLFIGYERSVYDEWWSEWAARDPALQFMEGAKLTAYTRRYRYRVAGGYWTARYKRSAIFSEFYEKYGFADAAGLFFRSGPTVAHLHVETGEVTDDEDEHARHLMAVVEPTLQAALQTIGTTHERAGNPYAVLDALAEPVAVVGPTGRWVHRSRAFDHLLGTLPDSLRASVVADLERRVLTFLDALSTLDSGGSADTRPAPLWTIDIFSVSATTIQISSRSGRCCLLRLQPRGGVTLGQTSAAGLTKREEDVAILLSEGLPTKVIAARLTISEHTVRRHSENIFRKLGVANRGSVASALRSKILRDAP
jgi:DNA-binding CsgD family transcriptional regulator